MKKLSRKWNCLVATILAVVMIVSNFGGLAPLTAYASGSEDGRSEEQPKEQTEASASETSAEKEETVAAPKTETVSSPAGDETVQTETSQEENSQSVKTLPSESKETPDQSPASGQEDSEAQEQQEDTSEETQSEKVITSFEYEGSYSYEIGSAPELIELNPVVKAAVNGEIVELQVAWSSLDSYSPGTAGKYVYTGTVPEGYTLAEGVGAPTVTVEVLEKKDDEKAEITSFTYTASYEYTIGKDAPKSIALTETVTATVDGEQKEISVKWTSDRGYKEDEAGEYIYTAEIPSDYKLADGVEAPKVVITLKEVSSRKLETAIEGTDTLITVEGNFPEGSSVIAAVVEDKLSNEILYASNKLNDFLSTSAYDIKVVKDGVKVELSEGDTAKVTIKTGSEIKPETKLMHVMTDLIDDQGKWIEGISGKTIEEIKTGVVKTEVVENTQINGDTISFELKSFSTIIAAAPGTATRISKLEISYDGVNYDLTQPDVTVANFGYRDVMTLHIEAQFGEGTEKELSVTVPEGLSFRRDASESSHYVVNGTDVTLKEKIVSGAGADILGVKQYNGTITLKFHGENEENNTKKVSLDIPIYSAWRNDYNSGKIPSGTTWFYGQIPNNTVNSAPVKVTQSIIGLSGEAVKNEYQLDKLIFNDEDSKLSGGTNWKSDLKPEIKVGGQMYGNDSFWIRPSLDKNVRSTKSVAYSSYSITFLAPEYAEFKGFKALSDKYTPNYKGAAAEITEAGGMTSNGYTVPAGYKGYTFTIGTGFINPEDLTVFPMWSFPESRYPAGKEVTVKVGDIKVRYYGKDYGADEYESFPEDQYPSLTYKIVGEYEEVFTQVEYRDKNRYTDGELNYTSLYMGAPGFEHNQERVAGDFMIGNRGSKDSKSKTITITYDVNDTKAIGVTEQRIPGSYDNDHKVSNISVKIWDSKSGTVSDWISYSDDASRTINLKDLGIKGGSGKYIKAVKFDIDTIPSQCLLSDMESRDKYTYISQSQYQEDSSKYKYIFHAVVLSNEAIDIKDKRLEHTIEIKNKDGDDGLPSGETVNNSGSGKRSAYTTISGKVFGGLQGKSLILGNNLDYDAGNVLQVGESNLVFSKVHFHKSTYKNAQLMDAIYLISPYGEEYTDIRMHYDDSKAINKDGKVVGFNIGKKRYYSNGNEQPIITEVPATEELKKVYPEAKIYKLDFTQINADQMKYDTRVIGGNMLSLKSLENNDLSTRDPWVGDPWIGDVYNGAWISFKYLPKLSDPIKKYEDLMWVEYNTDTSVPIEYSNEIRYTGQNTPLFEDIYNLTGGKSKMLGRMDPITLKKNEGLIVSSSIKQNKEVDSMYRTYNAGDPSTVVGLYRDAKYRLVIENNGPDVTGLSVYFPVPKTGENWGENINPEGPFKFSMNLVNSLKDVPKGFKVYYSQNARPTKEYADWDSNVWTEQSQTAGWTAADWSKVNLVKMVWINAEGIKKTDGKIQAVFDMTIDTVSTTEDQMHKVNVWSPYFLRKYASSESWVEGLPVATMITPGKLRGIVWEDGSVDNVLNGKFDDGESPVEGAKVELYDTSLGNGRIRAITYTDATGAYEFEGLKDGTAATEHNVYKIVVYRDGARYVSFTKPGPDMVFTPGDDHIIASLSGLDASSGSDVPSYNAGLVSRSVVAASPVVRKRVTGGPANASAFNFILQADPDNSNLPQGMDKDKMPMPKGTNAGDQQVTVQIVTANEGEAGFNDIIFNEVGTYSYKIREENTGVANYRYDTGEYRIVYKVSEYKQNDIPRLQVETQVIRDNVIIGGGDEQLIFTNVYTPPTPGGGGGGGGTPPTTTPRKPPAAPPVVPEVLGARRTDSEQVLGARKAEPKVLGARRGKTGEESSAMRLLIIAGLSTMLALLARSSGRKKED